MLCCDCQNCAADSNDGQGYQLYHLTCLNSPPLVLVHPYWSYFDMNLASRGYSCEHVLFYWQESLYSVPPFSTSLHLFKYCFPIPPKNWAYKPSPLVFDEQFAVFMKNNSTAYLSARSTTSFPSLEIPNLHPRLFSKITCTTTASICSSIYVFLCKSVA